jgi:hypothetical protein
MKQPRVELVIDQIVLHGVKADPRATRRALERELTRLFHEQGVPSSLQRSAVLSRLDAGRVSVSPNAKPGAVGRQVAHALYGGLKR